MPDVHVALTSKFIAKVINQREFFRNIRKAVSELFSIELPKIAVKPEYYAPGCDEGRPSVTVIVTVGQGERAPKHQELAEILVRQVKPIADKAIGGDAGEVKAIIDLELRKTATAGA